MKTKRKLAITAIAAMLLATLTACSETSGNEITPAQSDEVEISEVRQQDKTEENKIEETKEEEIWAYLPIEINGKNGFNDEIFKHIEASKDSKNFEIEPNKPEDFTTEEERQLYEHQLYERQIYQDYHYLNLASITKFYNLENWKNEKYELDSITISNSKFDFVYNSTQEKENSLGFYDYVQIGIDRFDYYETHKIDAFEEIKENLSNSVILIEDNILYIESAKIVFVRWDNIVLTVQATDAPDYEYLRDLAFDVIKNAELVTVKD